MKYLQKEKELLKKTQKEIQDIVDDQLKELIKWDSSREFIELELEICKRLNDIGAKLVESLIPKIYGDGYIGSRKDIDIDSEDAEKRISYRCEERNKTRGLKTVFGNIKISRAVYSEYFSGGQKSFLDEKLKIENKKTDPLMKYWTDLLGTIAPFEEASDILNKIRGIKVSEKQTQDSTEEAAKEITLKHTNEIENIMLDKEEKIQPANINLNLNAERTVYIETDGCQINTLDGWKECKTFMLFETEKINEKEHKLKNKYYYSTMKDVGEIKRRLKYDLEKYCSDEEVRIICVADGAKWIWKTMEQLFPKDKFHSGIIEIIDWYHALEKIGDLFDELSLKNISKEAFTEPYKKYLKKGNIELIEQELKMLMDKQSNTEMREKVVDALRYFINNKERMRYEKYKKKGLCIGSGAIESANKYVIQRRVKLQGMRWNEENANYMVHLRAEYINKQMDAHYGIENNPLLNQIAVT